MHAWSILRQLVANNAGFQGWERMLPHIDEAISWESVRNLSHMRNTLLIIRNIVLQNAVPEEICQAIEDITEILEEAIAIYP